MQKPVVRLFLIVFSLLFPLGLFASAISCRAAISDSFESRYDLNQLRKRWKSLSKEEKNKIRREHMESKDPAGLSYAERRPKVVTSGDYKDTKDVVNQGDVRLDNADPSLVYSVQLPDGSVKFVIGTSGHFKIEADSPVDLYRGGLKTVTRSRGFYKDGTEMTGAYHIAAWPWDAVIYKNKNGELIALGGVMEQPAPGQLPNVSEHNPTRSRWWGYVKHVKKPDGTYEEHIIWQGPVHDFNQAKHRGWVFHGYGGVLRSVFNPLRGVAEPIADKNGFYELDYERVTVAKTVSENAPNLSGNSVPWVTELFTRKMHPSLKYTVGPEIKVGTTKNEKTGEFFKGMRRGDPSGHTEGYLEEGGNFFRSLTDKVDLTIFSGGDYVRNYGIFAKQRTNPDRDFKPVVDQSGELINFAEVLNIEKIFNSKWVGRGVLDYSMNDDLVKANAEGRSIVGPGNRVYDKVTGKLLWDPAENLWLRAHNLELDKAHPEYSGVGWPARDDIFKALARNVWQVPVKLKRDNQGQYIPVLDIDPKYRFMYEEFL